MEYSKLCKGRKRRPSPINITKYLAKPKLYPPLEWSEMYGNFSTSSLILCDGRVIRLFSTSPEEFIIWGGPLKAKYILKNINFHWSLEDGKGSEHTFDEKYYPVEMQAIHEKLQSEENEADADNYLVVSYMFEITDEFNESLQQILNMVPRSMKFMNDLVDTEPFPLSCLIKKFTSHYLYYKGQLTEPDFEDALWLFCPCKINLTAKQLCIFRKCADYLPKMANNCRTIQPLYSRKIYYAI